MRSIDFAIITGLLEEFESLKEAIPSLSEEPDERQTEIWYRGRINSNRGFGYSVVATFQKDMGPLPANLLTKKLIERWDPAYIILLGIAGSFSKDVHLGDVIVSQQIFYYGPGKAVPDGIQYRPEGYPCSMVLIRQTQALTLDGTSMTQLRSEARTSALRKAEAASGNPNAADLGSLSAHEPSIHFGTVASGELVVASEAKQKELLALHGKILGTEMESAGVLHAAFFSDEIPTPAIMIKGISDHADHLKSREDEKKYWRQLAAENSIRTALALIRSGRIRPLKTDEFTIDTMRSATGEARDRIPRSASPGVSFLGFPHLIMPKGPLTQLTIEAAAIAGDKNVRIVEGLVEYRDTRGELAKASFPSNAPRVSLKGIGLAPIGLYLMLAASAESIHFRIEGPAGEQEIGLEIKAKGN